MERICGATFVFDHDGQPDLIGNELTGGSYRVMVGRAPAGEGPPMHVHPHTAEGFYIGEGEMTFVYVRVRAARRQAHRPYHRALARPPHLLAG